MLTAIKNVTAINKKISKIKIFFCFTDYRFLLKLAGVLFVATYFVSSIISLRIATESSIILTAF